MMRSNRIPARTAALTCSLLLFWAGCRPPVCEHGLDEDEDGLCDGADVDWSRDASIEPGTNRENIYGLSEEAMQRVYGRGLMHALQWPVPDSGAFVPYEALRTILEEDSEDPDVQNMRELARIGLGFYSMDELYAWLGAPRFNELEAEGPYWAPYPPGHGGEHRVGVSIVDTRWDRALTFSCGTCHSGRLLGRTVIGLTNRHARANEFFHFGLSVIGAASPELMRAAGDASDGEIDMLARTQRNLAAVGVKVPQVLGLDTSLAQVGLSLARREADEYATRSAEFEARPRPNELNTLVADSKPSVWWTLKYKTRWLADGSIVSGNPVLTNFLWNELGRGTDLRKLETWMQEEQRVADELTVAVFATRAPRWTDYFGAESIDLAAAQRGAAVFLDRCSECHGEYRKGWDASDAAGRNAAALLETVQVIYHERTPVHDVGTDPQRAAGMQHFAERLNELAISEWMEAVIEPTEGYVPPPLDGIWARYPYLHNNSVPNLCALLSPEAERPRTFVQGPSEDPETDYDSDCVGYPVGDDIPEDWWELDDAVFDAGRPGLSNAGHTSMFQGTDGRMLMREDERSDLIEFLKTL